MNAIPHTGRPATYPPPFAAWCACLVLTLGCVLGFADRGILNLFIIPIQRDLHLSDTQISLVIGLAFGVFNAVFGLPAARWVDSRSRTGIATVGVLLWSLATGVCGLATNFWQLFLARVAVGVGEATVTPSGVSLLADFFPPARRGLPVGVFYGGMFLGSGGSLLLGGLLWRRLGDRLIQAPLIGPLHSWQVILMLVAALGFIVAPLTFAIREPARIDGERQIGAGGVPIGVVARFYRTHLKALVGHNVGFCLHSFALHAGMAWIPTLLVRTYGWSLTQAGATYGIMMLILGPAGSAAAGLLADALSRRGRTDGKLLVCIGAGVVCAAMSIALALRLSPSNLLLALGTFAFFGTFSLPLAAGSLQEVMPNAMRGQAIAIYVAITNILAGSLAATAVAVLTDYVFHDRNLLRLAFGCVGFSACASSSLVLLATLASFRATVAATRAPAIADGAPPAAAAPVLAEL